MNTSRTGGLSAKHLAALEEGGWYDWEDDTGLEGPAWKRDLYSYRISSQRILRSIDYSDSPEWIVTFLEPSPAVGFTDLGQALRELEVLRKRLGLTVERNNLGIVSVQSEKFAQLEKRYRSIVLEKLLPQPDQHPVALDLQTV